MLTRLQGGLETLYRIATEVKVDQFVLDESARDAFGVERSPREQLLLSESNGELEIGLFVDQGALENLQRNDPSHALGEHNVGDFLLAVEGVSHFVYTVWRAKANRQVSALELELQGEVDKYVTCLLTAGEHRGVSPWLRQRLFVEFAYLDDLSGDERERYEVANSNASRYSASLERRFVKPGRMLEMLAELRRFYRLSLGDKLEFISAKAA